MYILSRKVLVSLRVFYYMPDHRSIIQEFIWQTEDVKPKYPRVNKYLNFWRIQIEKCTNYWTQWIYRTSYDRSLA